MTLGYGLAASVFVAFVAVLWAVWRVGRTQPARLLAGGFSVASGRVGRGAWALWTGIVLAIGGVAIVIIALSGKISAEAGFGGGAMILCGGLAWLGGTLRPVAMRASLSSDSLHWHGSACVMLRVIPRVAFFRLG